MSINLTAGMSSKLLSLQQTQRLMDTTQLKISAGLKVNSAILTFDFDSTTKAIGVDLAKDSLLSDLKIDYTTLVKNDNYNFHAVRNNGYKGIELNNLDIIVKTDDRQDFYASGIHNAGSGEITLNGTINISAPSDKSRGVCGLHGSGSSSKIMQKEDSVLNVSTSGGYGYGIIYGTNTLSGIVNITTRHQCVIFSLSSIPKYPKTVLVVFSIPADSEPNEVSRVGFSLLTASPRGCASGAACATPHGCYPSFSHQEAVFFLTLRKFDRF